jgi:CHAT domain-containing protein
MRLFIIIILLFNTTISFSQKKEMKEAVAEMERLVEESYNADAGIAACEAVLKLAEPNSDTYFEGYFSWMHWLLIKRDEAKLEELLNKLEVELLAAGHDYGSGYWTEWNYLKSRYNGEITFNQEKALIHIVYAFYSARKHPRRLPKIAQKTAIMFGVMGDRNLGRTILKVYKTSGQLSFKNDFSKSQYFLKLGYAYTSLEMYDEAKIVFEKAIKIMEPLKDEEPELYYECWYGLAANARLVSNEETIKIIYPIINNGYRDYKFIELIGEALSSDGHYEAALPLIQEAITKMTTGFEPKDYIENPALDATFINKKKAGYSFYYKSWALKLKGLELVEKGEKEKGIELLHHSIEASNYGITIGEKIIDGMTGYGVAELIANMKIHIVFGGLIHTGASLYEVTQAKEDLNNLLGYMEQRKCLLLHRSMAKSPLPEKLAAELKEYSERIEDYELRFGIVSEAQILTEIEDGVKDFLQFEKFSRTIKDYPKVRIKHTDIDFIDIEGIQSKLKEDEVFLEYSVVRQHIYSIVITKDNAEAIFLTDTADFELYIKDYLKIIRNPLLVQKGKRKDFIEQSNRLYNLLLKPFEPMMAGKKRLIISPERDLLFIPFETLLAKTDVKPFHELDFLVKNFEINYHYSETLHDRTQKKRAPIHDLSALTFAPVFVDGGGTGSKDRSIKLYKKDKSIFKRKKIIHLPNSKREVETIRKILSDKGEVTELLMADATQQNFLIEAKRKSYQFIHIATHSMVSGDNDPRLAAIACYQANEKSNLLFATTISRAPMEADLVILSSCESGLGQIIDGEGLLGLNRSFINAGARNVLFSLWKVSDKYSSDSMIGFYENYIKTRSYTTSLSQVKRQMLEDPVLANPRFWAAFVLLGE